jgi:signal transduction histidine kinase
MKLQYIPHEYWDWRSYGLVFIAAVTPIVSLAWLATDQPNALAAAASLDGLVRGPAAVVGALCLYVAWRISAKPSLGWLAMASSSIAVQAVMLCGLQLADPGMMRHQALWMSMFDAITLAFVAGVSIAATRHEYTSEPLVVGGLCGLALGVGRLLGVAVLPRVDAGWMPIVLCFLIFTFPATWLLQRVPEVPRWASDRFAWAVLLYSTAHLAIYLDGGTDKTTGNVVTIAADLAGAVLLISSTTALLRQTIHDDTDARDELQVRLDELEAGLRHDRARIHEINSTIAGVVSASRLLREDSSIGTERRGLLENMVHAELGRLQRLLNHPVAVPQSGIVDLDDTIGNLVLAQEARGNRVNWLPSGARVAGEPDDVAEVLNILLDNAVKHGSADASVTVQSVADAVEIVVSDGGPGIAPEVLPHLFEWGRRGPRSAGQGIGLTIARDLTARHGGYLRVREGSTCGATFVAGFPAARRGGDEQINVT